LKADALQDLPGLFRTLPDNRYAIYLVRPETETYRLVLEVNVRNGKVIDPGDDSDGARDRPPTEATPGLVQPTNGMPQGKETLPAGSDAPSLRAIPTEPALPADVTGSTDATDSAGSSDSAVSVTNSSERLPGTAREVEFPSQDSLPMAAGGIWLASTGTRTGRSSSRLPARTLLQDAWARETDRRLACATPARWRRLRRLARQPQASRLRAIG
jgi:hypothetical protein